LHDGEVRTWAEVAVRILSKTYGEVSPSGTGIKFIARGRLPGPGVRKPVLGPEKKGAFEVYDRDRYFTLTGRAWSGVRDIVEMPDAIEFIYRMLTPQKRPQAKGVAKGQVAAVASTTSTGRLDASDAELLARAAAARNGVKFTALWRGDVRGFLSPSEADLALLGILLFWCGGDATRAEALFGQSALGRRAKWRSRADYRELTLGRALRDLTATFSQRRPSRY
jgi:putative DNA primase/helicase